MLRWAFFITHINPAVGGDNKAFIFLIKRITASFPPTADKFQVNRGGMCVDIRVACSG